MRQHITGESRRALWWKADDIDRGIQIVTREWEQKLRQLRFDTKEQHEEAHSMGNGPSYWRLIERKNYPLLAQQLRQMEKLLKKRMHGRQRSHDRQQMQNASAAREKAVADGKIGKAIKSILGKPTQQYDMHSLTLPSGELVMEPQKVHDTHAKHWKEWMGGSGIETFFDQYSIDWTQPQELWPQFRDYPAHQQIPADLVLRIWDAIILPANNFHGLREEIAEALNLPISMEDLRQAIKRAPGTSVPGPSGLSYAMMKEWPESVLIKAH
jgi:hypothetical protein